MSLKAFSDDGTESNWEIVIQAVYFVPLGYRNDGGRFQVGTPDCCRKS